MTVFPWGALLGQTGSTRIRNPSSSDALAKILFMLIMVLLPFFAVIVFQVAGGLLFIIANREIYKIFL